MLTVQDEVKELIREIYMLSPYKVTPQQLGTISGSFRRMSVERLKKEIEIMRYLIDNGPTRSDKLPSTSNEGYVSGCLSRSFRLGIVGYDERDSFSPLKTYCIKDSEKALRYIELTERLIRLR